ncbi:MAG: cyclic nucleotide-binding domain-containing protein, partial [Pseudomonadota bacterium]
MTAVASSALRTDCQDCPIRHRAVCARCEPAELRTLEAMKSYRRVDAGETILYADDDMPIVASIVTGVVSLSRTLEDGRRQMVGLLLPSDFIGRPGRAEAPFDVVAATDTLL